MHPNDLLITNDIVDAGLHDTGRSLASTGIPYVVVLTSRLLFLAIQAIASEFKQIQYCSARFGHFPRGRTRVCTTASNGPS